MRISLFRLRVSSLFPDLRLPSSVWIGLFVGFVSALIAGNDAWRSLEDYHVEIAQIRSSMQNMSRSLVHHAEGTAEIADAAIFGVVARLEQEGISPGVFARLSASLPDRAAVSSRLWSIFIVDAEGRLLASSLPGPPDQAPLENGYLRHHRENADRGPYVGPPMREPSSGLWLITVSRRFDNVDGTFAGVVVATLDVEFFARHFAQFDIGQRGVIALFGRDGLLLSRRPFDPALVNSDMSNSPLFTTETALTLGSYRYVSRIDQIERLAGFARSTRFPFAASAAVSIEEALQPWRASAGSRLVVDLGLVAIVIILGLLLMAHASRRQSAERQLAELARTDAVTGLANRRAFDAEIAREWRRAARAGKPLSLLLLDLDRFKRFNDSYGHQAGDACLRAVGDTLVRSLSRAGDFTARYGGEELVVLLADMAGPGAVAAAEKVRAAIEAVGIPHAGNVPYGVVTASIGVATVTPTADLTPDALLLGADAALYDAKAGGRNRIAVSAGLVFCPLPRTSLRDDTGFPPDRRGFAQQVTKVRQTG
jgi:diguanylate cyclase (GGDEF)-like protein